MELENKMAKAGKFGLQLTIGEEARIREAMEYRFGPFANLYLARLGIVTDGESRWKVIKALGDALTFAYRKLALNAEGDYSPDPAAERFPAQPPAHVPRTQQRGLTVGAVFDLWSEA